MGVIWTSPLTQFWFILHMDIIIYHSDYYQIIQWNQVTGSLCISLDLTYYPIPKRRVNLINPNENTPIVNGTKVLWSGVDSTHPLLSIYVEYFSLPASL